MNRPMNEVTQEVPDSLEGERGVPSVNDSRPSSIKKGIGIVFLLAIALGGTALTWFSIVRTQKDEANKAVPKDMQVTSAVPARSFDLPPPPPPPPPEAAEAVEISADGTVVPAASMQGTAGTSTGARPPRPRRLAKGSSSLMIGESDGFGGGAGSPQGAPVSLSGSPAAAPGSGGLLAGPSAPQSAIGAMLGSGMSSSTSNAARFADRNFLLAKGAFIDCGLRTKLVSTVPGMTECMVTRNVYSDNGRVVLIERGSTVTGEYQSNVQRGQSRIFVLWSRVKTPNGIIVDLNSPGTDPLGGSGLPGKVNNHFWQRFGAALLMSIVDDAAQYATAVQQSKNRDSGNDVQFYMGNTSDGAQDMANEVLKASLNIPPTLTKNQGERINIYVARDLNFGNVYALRSQ